MAPKSAPDGAILQRDKETYAIVPRTPMGMLNAEYLERILNVVKEYNIPIVKITSGQRLALVGMTEDQIDPIWDALGRDIGRATELCVHYVQACPGTAVCKFGKQDSLGLGQELEEKYLGVDFPAKVKFGISGCPLSCAEGKVRDIGVYGSAKGFTLTFGGIAGLNPRIADVIAEDISREELVALIDKLLAYYKENARKRERSSKFVDRVGIDVIKAAVL